MLLECFPVIATCNLDALIAQSMRLMGQSSVPKRGLLKLVCALTPLSGSNRSFVHLAMSKTLAALCVCDSGSDAVVCLSIVLSCIDFARQDQQLLNTVIGLSDNMYHQFQDVLEVRHLHRKILDASTVRVVGPLIPIVQQTMTEIPVGQVTADEPVIPVVQVTMAKPVVPETNLDDSPKSSCPSLC